MPRSLCTESGPFRMLGNLRPAFPRSHMRRKSLIGGTAGPFFGRAGTSLTGRQHPEWTALPYSACYPERLH